MNISFIPSHDVSLILNALLDILERRASSNEIRATLYESQTTQHATRSIKIHLADISLPNYFSQTDPTPRIIANEQLVHLEKNGLLKLAWIPGETGHLLQSITLMEDGNKYASKHAQADNGTHNKQQQGLDTHKTLLDHQPTYQTHNTERETRQTYPQALYHLTNRTPLAANRSRLENHLLAEKFRFTDDWRARAIHYILNQLKAGKSPAPFNLTDSNLTLDLLAALVALPTLTTETPYRAFSVRVFNDSKRLEVIKNQLVSLARIGNPEWKRIPAEEVLRELNLVANPNYIHFSGNWQFTTENGEILSLAGYTPSIGFPSAQTTTLQSVQAKSVLCIENLTTFYEYIRAREAAQRNTLVLSRVEGQHETRIQVNTETSRHEKRNTQHSILCTYGNPSPAVRRVLRLLPETTPILLWSDMDYGGFNILSQLRRFVSEQIRPHLMDVDTLESNIPRARPLTASDQTHLKRLLLRPELHDVRPVIEHILKRGLKLEQEGVEIF